eukprot:PhF_6_TR9507/c0_g1_i1/m.14818
MLTDRSLGVTVIGFEPRQVDAVLRRLRTCGTITTTEFPSSTTTTTAPNTTFNSVANTQPPPVTTEANYIHVWFDSDDAVVRALMLHGTPLTPGTLLGVIPYSRTKKVNVGGGHVENVKSIMNDEVDDEYTAAQQQLRKAGGGSKGGQRVKRTALRWYDPTSWIDSLVAKKVKV